MSDKATTGCSKKRKAVDGKFAEAQLVEAKHALQTASNLITTLAQSVSSLPQETLIKRLEETARNILDVHDKLSITPPSPDEDLPLEIKRRPEVIIECKTQSTDQEYRPAYVAQPVTVRVPSTQQQKPPQRQEKSKQQQGESPCKQSATPAKATEKIQQQREVSYPFPKNARQYTKREAISILISCEEKGIKPGSVVFEWKQKSFIPVSYATMMQTFKNFKRKPSMALRDWGERGGSRRQTIDTLFGVPLNELIQREMSSPSIYLPPLNGSSYGKAEAAQALFAVECARHPIEPVIDEWIEKGHIPVGRDDMTAILNEYKKNPAGDLGEWNEESPRKPAARTSSTPREKPPAGRRKQVVETEPGETKMSPETGSDMEAARLLMALEQNQPKELP